MKWSARPGDFDTGQWRCDSILGHCGLGAGTIRYCTGRDVVWIQVRLTGVTESLRNDLLTNPPGAGWDCWNKAATLEKLHTLTVLETEILGIKTNIRMDKDYFISSTIITVTVM